VLRLNQLAGFLLVSFLAAPAIANTNACKDALVPDIVNVSYDRVTAMALLNILSDEQISTYSSSSALAATGYGDFNNDRSRTSIKNYFEQQQFALNESKSLDLLISKVPIQARLKYYDCVKSGQEVQLRVESLDENGLILKVLRGGLATSPDTVELSWSTNEPRLTSMLERDAPKLGRTGSEKLIQYNQFNPKEGIAITVNATSTGLFSGGKQVGSDVLSIPALPSPPASTVFDEQWSLPLYVRMHFAQVGDLDYTINAVGEFKNGDKTRGKLRRDGIAGEGAGQTQEILIDWDREAMSSLGVPFNLSKEELSFNYSCWYLGAPFQSSLQKYTASPGKKCGDQNAQGGEPILRKFSMELTGSLKNKFKLTYKCNTLGPFEAGAVCEWTGNTGIGQLVIEIDTDPR